MESSEAEGHPMSSISQADLVVSRLKQMISEDARALYVKPEVMADYEDWSRETMKVTLLPIHFSRTYLLVNLVV